MGIEDRPQVKSVGEVEPYVVSVPRRRINPEQIQADMDRVMNEQVAKREEEKKLAELKEKLFGAKNDKSESRLPEDLFRGEDEVHELEQLAQEERVGRRPVQRESANQGTIDSEDLEAADARDRAGMNRPSIWNRISRRFGR